MQQSFDKDYETARRSNNSKVVRKRPGKFLVKNKSVETQHDMTARGNKIVGKDRAPSKSPEVKRSKTLIKRVILGKQAQTANPSLSNTQPVVVLSQL